MPPAADYRSAIADYIRANALPVDKYAHQPRLYALAKRLGDGGNRPLSFQRPFEGVCWNVKGSISLVVNPSPSSALSCRSRGSRPLSLAPLLSRGGVRGELGES